jgi:hypothetical protein
MWKRSLDSIDVVETIDACHCYVVRRNFVHWNKVLTLRLVLIHFVAYSIIDNNVRTAAFWALRALNACIFQVIIVCEIYSVVLALQVNVVIDSLERVR